MQLSPVSFKGNYNQEFSVRDLKNDADIKKIEKAIEIVRSNGDSFKTDDDEIQKKTKGQILASVAVGAAFAFAVGKGAFKKGTDFANGVKKFLNNETVVSFVKGVKEKIGEIKVPNKVKQYTVDTKVAQGIKNAFDVVSKKGAELAKSVKENTVLKAIGAPNMAGAATAIASTAAVLKTDGDANGVADIAEKGVNAYKETLERFAFVEEVVNALT